MAMLGCETSLEHYVVRVIIPPSVRRPSIDVFGLGTMAFRHPDEEILESRTLSPQKTEELRCAQCVHVSAKECFEAPAKIWAGPRAQSVTLGGRPVVAESGEHQSGYFQPWRSRSEVMCATWWRLCQA